MSSETGRWAQNEFRMADQAGGTMASRVRAVEFVRRMRGASQPCLLRCEDGESYVVKFQNNPQHARVLANEMLASRLAQLVSLPVATPAFVDVSCELIEGNPHLTFLVGDHSESFVAGVQFGSRFPGIPNRTLVVDFLPDRLLRRVQNLDTVFAGALVFDKWTGNCDGRQMIFHRPADHEGSSYCATMIDQGFCFNDGDWTFRDSPILGIYPRRLVYENVRGLRSFEPLLSQIENLSPAELEGCTVGIPTDWCQPDPTQLVRLIEILYERRRTLRQAIVDTKHSPLDPFPNWGA